MARSSVIVKTWKTRVLWLSLIIVGINGGSLIAGKYWSSHKVETRWYTRSSSRRLLSTVQWERCDFEIRHARNYSAHPEKWNTPASAYGWVVAYILAILVVFVALAIVCDDFFVPSLEVISERLDLPEDVAGATFMAAGSSAPELFTSIAGVTVESDVGVGTIVGSAVFNLLGIVALSAAFAGTTLQLDWRPFARDTLFYTLSIICFILFAWDSKFKLWESVIMLLLYASYIVLMKFNPQLMDLLAKIGKKSIHPRENGNPAAPYIDNNEASKGERDINLEMKADSQDSVTFAAVKTNLGTPDLYEHRVFSHVKKGEIAAIAHGMGEGETPHLCHNASKLAYTKSITEAEIESATGGNASTNSLNGHTKLPPIDSKTETVKSSNDCGKSPDPLLNYKGNNGQIPAEDEDDDSSVAICPCLPPVVVKIPSKPDSKYCCCRWTRMSLSWILFLVSMPFVILFTWTIPNCSKPKLQRYYLVSFTMSIIWIALLSFAMVTLVGRCGCILGVDRFTMGLVIVAIGTSVPDALSSIIVARDGYGDMAVSNAIGSNVFDIDLGIGLPFLISSLIRNMEPVQLLSDRDQMLYDSGRIQMIPHVKFGFILLLILLITLIVFGLTRFRLNKVLGMCLVTLYIGFVIYSYFQDIHCNHSC